MLKKIALGVAVATLTSGAATAQAETFSANNFLDASHPFSVENYTNFAERVKERTDGDISFDVFLGGVLLGGRASLSGTGDGVAQVAYHAGTYTPSDLPITNLISELAFLTDNFYALAAASTIMSFTHPALIEEYKKNGVVFGGGYGTPIYYLICNKPIRNAADLEGKRLRMPGGIWDRWASAMGAVSVNVPSSEIYTGLDRGTLDCGVNPLDSLLSRSYWDVAKYVPMIPLGSYYSGPMWAYNIEFWQNRTDEQRAILLEEAGAAFIRSALMYLDNSQKAIDQGESEHGMEFIQVDPALMEKHVNFVASDSAALVSMAQEQYGVSEELAVDLIDTFKAIVAEWEKKLEGVEMTDKDTLTKLFVEDIYKKVDVSTFGMN
ncbi:MAG: C4-dicarboxylate TRAP transporter substrate-binding protein [Alphaproteobacteria bacterium]|nr:C4-dicarboxylate TRAP transporter substrate-binding protein [Alphaproteobacteria bacterium]MBO6861197.1 C4-dicarboxylate TRAP transporter substrate-binding protein [Alphaproteobacteria bacterium]